MTGEAVEPRGPHEDDESALPRRPAGPPGGALVDFAAAVYVLPAHPRPSMTEPMERLKAALIDRYLIERELGAGGMGIVYAAVDERLGRHVALKILKPDSGIDPERRKRLAWDARAASALNHPNIVTVYETGDSAGVAYVAMELVPGRTLAE